MNHFWNIDKDKLKISYQWKKNKQWNSIAVEAINKESEIKKGSEIEFISEHYWGYAKDKNKTTEYEVKHPKWKHYPVVNYKVEVDFLAPYGENFECLQSQKPSSVFLMEGSWISVENKKVL
jgi:hypothetical protein